MNRTLHILLILILLTAADVLAQPLKLVFHGAEAFSTRELTAFLSWDREAGVPPDSGQLASLVDSLITRDFLFARIDSFRIEERRRRSLLHLYIDLGSLAEVSDVFWIGDSLAVPSSVSSRVLTVKGAVFRWSNLRFDIDQILSAFEESGFPFARIELRDIRPDRSKGTVEVWLKILSGPETVVDYISFSGNQLTRESFLLKESRLKPGFPYDQNRIDAGQKRLSKLPFLQSVRPAEIVVDKEGRTGVHYALEEGRSTHIDVVAGYLPETETTDAEITGLVDLEFLNLFGLGKRGRVHWSRPDSRIQEFDISYREPWIFNWPIAWEAEFGQRIEDTLFVTREYGCRLIVSPSAAVSLWGALFREEVLTDSLSEILLNLPDSRTTYVEAGVSMDTRDHPTNPCGGVYFSSFAGTGWRKRERSFSGQTEGSFTQHRVGIDSEASLRVLPFWIAYLGMHGRDLESDEPEILLPDLYRLGGARSLRGYREEQFLGSRIGWVQAEIRYWLGPASRFFFFTDVGGIYRERLTDGIPESTTLFKTAAGFGLRLNTNLGIWGIDYGIGEDDRLLTGKIHVSLLSSF